VIIVISPLLLPYGLSETHGAAARLAILFLLTLALSSLSWHWLEQPFLAWKNALGSRAKPETVPEKVPAPQAEPAFA
jgi:peptidoglycan/LPS O-acetylase OafA/YrhL